MRPNTPAVVEFFELFKTPWEFYRPGAQYDVLLCSNSRVPENNARLLLLYGAAAATIRKAPKNKDKLCSLDKISFFSGVSGCQFMEVASSSTTRATKSSFTKEQTRLRSHGSGAQAVVRLGFDLFKEVRHLLTRGQPAEFANIPTLELHISLLRELIVSQGVTLVEIPPVPAGYRFIVSLTHDVDHPARAPSHSAITRCLAFSIGRLLARLSIFAEEEGLCGR